MFILTSFYITLDILGRKFLSVSTALTDELGGYALAFGSMWPLAWTLRTGGHVRIDILLPYLPGTLCILLDYLAMAVMLSFAGFLSTYSWHLTIDSFLLNARAPSFLGTPLWVPQGFLTLGLTMLAIEALFLLTLGVIESLKARAIVALEPAPEDPEDHAAMANPAPAQR
jgi:TRAP-type C4-dicarboxylate transport system permease small subunit